MSGNRNSKRHLRVDVHTHILPESWPDLKARYGYGGFIELRHHEGCKGKASMFKDDGTPFREVEDNLWSLNRRASDMDSQNIDVHVLSTVPVMFSYWAKPEDTHDLSMMLNDHVARCVNERPDRFIGLGTLPMQSPDLAVDELKRCVNELGLAGVQIGSHINEWTLDDKRLFPIFKAAEEVGAAIFIHPWDMMGSELMRKYFLPWLVGMPAETSLAICSMMFGGIFERLPNLRVCFAHGGGAFPSTIGRIQHGWDVRPDLCARDTSISPRDQLGKFWSDSLVHDADALDLICNVFGEDKVCLGSDYPFPLGEYTPESRGMDYCAGELIDSMGIWSDNEDDDAQGCGDCCARDACCCGRDAGEGHAAADGADGTQAGASSAHAHAHAASQDNRVAGRTADCSASGSAHPHRHCHHHEHHHHPSHNNSNNNATLPIYTVTRPCHGAPWLRHIFRPSTSLTFGRHASGMAPATGLGRVGRPGSASSNSTGLGIGAAAAAGSGESHGHVTEAHTTAGTSNGHNHTAGSCTSCGHPAPSQRSRDNAHARPGWNEGRRRKVLGSNAMEWLGQKYEDFVRW